MQRWVCGLAIALSLTACQGTEEKAEAPPSEAEVQAGTTKDSADPRLNALQRTKRTIHGIEADRKQKASEAEGAEH
ncbi:hypothetical protein D3C72_544400 [compost metagenome]